jgi:hypothetical protein
MITMARGWRFWVSQALVLLFALWMMLGGPALSVRAPLRFSGTGLLALADAKLSYDKGRWWTLTDVGAWDPEASPVRPGVNAHVDAVVLRIAHLASRRVPAIVTLWWTIMLLVGAAAAAWSVRRLGGSATGAWCGGILFALSPFALARNTSGFGLMPSFVPFAGYAAVALAIGPAKPERTAWSITVAGCALMALNSIEYGVLGGILVAVGLIAGYVRRRADSYVLRAGGLVLAAIAIALIVNVLSTRAASDAPAIASHAGPADAEFLSLKLRQLITPLPDHWLAPLRRWAASEAAAQFPPTAPGMQLGIIASLGLIALLVIVFAPRLAGRDERGESLQGLSRLTLAALLIGMTAGLGAVFTLLVAPAFTDYTGLAAFIAFFAIAGFALIVDRLLGRRPLWCIATWTTVLVLGLCDHAVAIAPVLDRRGTAADNSQGIRDLVVVLERELPAGARVAQLPIQTSLQQQLHMHGFDPLKPFVMSRTLRWTYPPVTADDRRWLEEVSTLAPDHLVDRLRQDGISAVLIDKFAYPADAEGLLSVLQKSLSTTEPLVTHNRYVALDLRQH